MVTFSKISVSLIYIPISHILHQVLTHFSFKRWRSLIVVTSAVLNWIEWNFNVTIQGFTNRPHVTYVDSQYCTINLLTFYLGTTWKETVIQLYSVAKANELKKIIKIGDDLMSSISLIRPTANSRYMFGIVQSCSQTIWFNSSWTRNEVKLFMLCICIASFLGCSHLQFFIAYVPGPPRGFDQELEGVMAWEWG